MTGSWAGAMGHTQFIPTSYQAFAVDFDGDGRRDIWSADPSDALASTAAYLQRNGWRTGQPWGLEVLLPNGFSGPTGRGNARSAAQWRAAGVRRADGRALPDHGPGSILTPSGRSGPAFLVYRNFRVLLSYNNAENYAIGVGHLSDRITGGNAISGTADHLDPELATLPEGNPPANAGPGHFIEVCDEATQAVYDRIWTNVKK